MSRPTIASTLQLVDALTERVGALEVGLESALQALSQAHTRLQELESRPAPTVIAKNGKALFPCDATSNCIGHPQEHHIEIHRRQIAKNEAKAAEAAKAEKTTAA